MFPRKLLFVILLMLSSFFNVFSQSDKIKEYLKMVREGKITEVKLILPDLLAEFPNDPGVQFLHATVLDDANKAVEIYERIIRNYPQNEYADECYWRIIQYFALKGEIERASRELDNYRKSFPNSAFLTPASDLIRTAVALARVNPRTKVTPSKEKEQSQDISKEVPSSETEKLPFWKSEQSSKKGTFGLQVGLYSTIESAKSEVERFRSMRLRADIYTKKIDSGTTMYAVVIGDYPTREKAEAEKPIVQEKCGCTPIIYVK
ncbi:MAG: SPOR domain-containing protein [Candidatus Kapaibacteriales bacterium]